jgi:uncharacterized protein (DUF1697 family)
MKTYIALLRGINVGGHKKILMADLRAFLESAGLKEIQTYIQSGNVIFRSEASAKKLQTKIETTIKNQYGWEVPVIVRTPSEIEMILMNCPFPEEKKQNSYFNVLAQAPEHDLIPEIQALSSSSEEFHITDTCIYFWSENYRKSKFSNNFFERKLKVKVTARNYRTMMKLVELSS